MRTKTSKYVLCFSMLAILLASGCGAAPTPEPTLIPTIADTATSTPMPTETFTPTATLVPTKTPIPTATPNIAATHIYDGLQAMIQQLVTEKIVPSADGKYRALDDYSDSFAKSRYYGWKTYDDFTASNFIIQAKVVMENATNEDVYKAGCGFAIVNTFDSHGIFFALDGNANYWDNGYSRGTNYLDNTLYEANPDGLTLSLVLYNKALNFYVNGRKALSGVTIYGEPFNIGPAILSGTSEGFGTRCTFSEMAVWEFAK